MRKALLEYLRPHFGKRYKLRCLARVTVEDAMAKRLPDSVVYTDVVVLKDPKRHCVLWVGKTWRMPDRMAVLLAKTHPLGRFIRDNMPESLSWRFVLYDAGEEAYAFRHYITRATTPPLNGYGELPGHYETGGYLVALMERQLKKRRRVRYWRW